MPERSRMDALGPWSCPCSPADALALLLDQAAKALTGDPFERALLPNYVEHYLVIVARRHP